jgi:hypothetical protein
MFGCAAFATLYDIVDKNAGSNVLPASVNMRLATLPTDTLAVIAVPVVSTTGNIVVAERPLPILGSCVIFIVVFAI